MIAALSSSEITPLAYLSNGEVAPATRSRSSIRSVAASIAFRTPLSRTLVPAGGMTISWAVVPVTCGNVRASESSAVWDSVPGRLNSSWNLPPATPAIPASTTRAPSQAISTAMRRRNAARPSPYRNDDTLTAPSCDGYTYVSDTVLYWIQTCIQTAAFNCGFRL